MKLLIRNGNSSDKLALLRQTFELDAAYYGNLLSFNKMVESLQDVGNVTTPTSQFLEMDIKKLF